MAKATKKKPAKVATKRTAKKATKKQTARASNRSTSKSTKKKSTGGKATARKPAAKKSRVEPIKAVTVETDTESVAAKTERRGGDRRKVQRRRQIDPTTCERDYSNEEIEFMRAMDEYKRNNGRMFPTCSEILEVVRTLGYVRQDAALRDATTDDPLETAGESEHVGNAEPVTGPLVAALIDFDASDGAPTESIG